MAPTYTMSAHLCKQIYTSWRQTRQTSPEPHRNPLPSPSAALASSAPYFHRASSPEKRSMDSDRSDGSASMSRQKSSSSWSSSEK